MRRTAAALIAAAVLTGTAGVASTEIAGPSGAAPAVAAEALRVDDVWVDAERTFDKVDADADGLLDVDEFAAQAVAYADLARAEGAVPVDGRQPVRLVLPRRALADLGSTERTAIDAVARGAFYAFEAGGRGLTRDDWIALRLEGFGAADRDEDGQLLGAEVQAYASAIAQLPS